jgi:hypothetical protein
VKSQLGVPEEGTKQPELTGKSVKRTIRYSELFARFVDLTKNKKMLSEKGAEVALGTDR